jgi:hypothetical protein
MQLRRFLLADRQAPEHGSQKHFVPCWRASCCCLAIHRGTHRHPSQMGNMQCSQGNTGYCFFIEKRLRRHKHYDTSAPGAYSVGKLATNWCGHVVWGGGRDGAGEGGRRGALLVSIDC